MKKLFSPILLLAMVLLTSVGSLSSCVDEASGGFVDPENQVEVISQYTLGYDRASRSLSEAYWISDSISNLHWIILQFCNFDYHSVSVEDFSQLPDTAALATLLIPTAKTHLTTGSYGSCYIYLAHDMYDLEGHADILGSSRDVTAHVTIADETLPDGTTNRTYDVVVNNASMYWGSSDESSANFSLRWKGDIAPASKWFDKMLPFIENYGDLLE